MYTINNFRYLRISKTSVLPLNLLLSNEDLEWFNDYSFQEVLSVLKPLLQSRIELYNRGHIIKRTITPSTYNSLYQDLDDGLEDAGVILGGEGANATSENQGPETSLSTAANKGKRRKGTSGPGNRNPSDRPQFSVRFGMRPSTSSERGGAVLVAEKNLGFLKVKKEQVDDEKVLSEGNETKASQRVRMDLAALEGEGTIEDTNGIVIREENDSDSLRVGDFRQGSNGDGNGSGDEDLRGVDGDDTDYQDQSGATKRKQPAKEAKRKGKGKRAKKDDLEVSSSQADQKPTLQISYGSLKLHPQTLYVVVRSLESLTAPASSSILPFTTYIEPIAPPMPEAGGSSSIIEDRSAQQEEEDSLFPPGMDYFLP
ncbi:hypothetical protein EDD21DRAFT_404968 [Dissophora ornata]|nr:hypothetical protein BGZ58_002790 [Dissophora ornata]KAI8600788.1 hypothetical protein EDD21DRAFT_404968 [Dissophora ornata]